MKISEFPDVLVLNIFSYMSVKELCKISRVCRSWRCIAYDKSLWRDIDMTNFVYLDLRKVWKFYRSRLSDVLRSLKMVGYYNKTSGTARQKKHVLSDALLEEISTACPNIVKLQLRRFYLEKMSSSRLPQSVTHLQLRECAWPLGWLKGAQLPELIYLDLGRTSRIGDSEMEDIAKFVHLEELNLEELYRLGDTGVKQLAENYIGLKVLNLRGTKITDLGVHHICRHMVGLTGLDLGSTEISDSSLDNLGKSLPKLKSLGCAGTKITDYGIKCLCYSKNSSKLLQLDIASTNVTDEALTYITEKMINLESIDVINTKVSQSALDNMSTQLVKLTYVMDS